MIQYRTQVSESQFGIAFIKFNCSYFNQYAHDFKRFGETQSIVVFTFGHDLRSVKIRSNFFLREIAFDLCAKKRNSLVLVCV